MSWEREREEDILAIRGHQKQDLIDFTLTLGNTRTMATPLYPASVAAAHVAALTHPVTLASIPTFAGSFRVAH